MLGLVHEHQRSNRDDHLQVNKSNIMFWAYSNFEQYSANGDNAYGTPYDFSSVMHYSKTVRLSFLILIMKDIDKWNMRKSKFHASNIIDRISIIIIRVLLIAICYHRIICVYSMLF